MWRLMVATGMLALLVLAPAGCKRRRRMQSAAPAEDDGQLVSVVNVADPRAAPQLGAGFYGVEGGAWRWTMKKFEVTLRPPAGAAQNGATLELKLTIPQVILDRVGPVTLSGTVRGVVLSPETFSKAGESKYRREIPASALAGDEVTVEFAADKGVIPSQQDQRELAVIVSTIGLLPK
jgi:hypothetical protein